MTTGTGKKGRKKKTEVELTGSLAVAGDLATQAVEQGTAQLEESEATLDTLMEATVPSTDLPHAATNPDADNPLIGLYGAGEILRVLQDRIDDITAKDDDPDAPKLSEEEQEARLQEVSDLCAAHLEAFSNSEEAIAQLLGELKAMQLQEKQIDSVADIWYREAVRLRGEAKAIRNARRVMDRAVLQFLDEHNGGQPLKIPGFKLSIRTANEPRVAISKDQVPGIEELLEKYRDFLDIELDEATIKQALKDGEDIPFARLLEKTRYVTY